MRHDDQSRRAHHVVRQWACLLPAVAATLAGGFALRWILASPPWQAQPWPLWIAGTSLVLGVVGAASAFVSALAVVVTFEGSILRPHGAVGEYTARSPRRPATVPVRG